VRPADWIEDDVDTVAGKAAHTRDEILLAIINCTGTVRCHCPMLRCGSGGVELQASEPSELKQGLPHSTSRSMNEGPLARCGPRDAVEQLVGG
jgi:hypothetical protein